jgi:hypothetical protein
MFSSDSKSSPKEKPVEAPKSLSGAKFEPPQKPDAPGARVNPPHPEREVAQSVYQPAPAPGSFQAKMAAFSGGAIPQPPAATPTPAAAPQKLAIPPAFTGAQKPPEPGKLAVPPAFADRKASSGKK